MAHTRTKKKPGQRGYKVQKTMHEFKRGILRSGVKRGPKVTSRKQAIAIGLAEARRYGEPGASKTRKTAKRKTTRGKRRTSHRRARK